MAGLPDLLTVEEAARVLRVGRTKAYAMAREWRVTGGRSGLPVVDFGHALRVPLCQLEALLGGPLTGERASADATAVAVEATPTANDSIAEPPAPEVAEVSDPDSATTSSRALRRPSRRRNRTPDQPTLPFAD